jgi:iron complex transport system substrate-binding protein
MEWVQHFHENVCALSEAKGMYKTMKKLKIFSLIMVMLICSATLVGCTTSTSESSGEETTGTVEITDMAGRTVTIPANVNTIATPNVDAYRILLQLGAEDMLVGVPSNMYGSQYSQEDTIEVTVWPEVKNLEQVGGGPPGSEINAEALMALEPDVVISWSYGKQGSNASEQADSLQEKTGIPVVCLNNIQSDNVNLDAITNAYTLIGQIAGEEAKAQELLDYYEERVKEITDITDQIPADQIKTSYMASVGGILKATNNYLPMKQLGVTNVAEELGANGGEISQEQLIAWNPEIIYIHTASTSHRFDMDEVANDPSYSSISAIANDNYYHIKGTYMGWDIATGLVDLLYMAKVTYPEQFEDLNVEKAGDEVLEYFYGMEGLYQRLIDYNDYYEFDE